MKKLIAVTVLAGLVAVGCAHRGGSSDRESRSYGEGSSMPENTTTPSTQPGTSSNPSGSSTSPSDTGSSSSNPSNTGPNNNSLSQPSNSSTPQ